MPVQIVGIGKALPTKRVANDDLPASLETSDEWIRSHTGIGSRYICNEDETSATLGIKACKAAIANAQAHGSSIKEEDVCLVVSATTAPEYWGFPSNACLIQNALNAKGAAAFDLSAACSGFIYSLQTAYSLMKQMNYKNAVVVGSESLSKITDWNDRGTCVLFGDGAGAVILENVENAEEDCIGTTILGADGSGAEFLYLGKDDLHIHMDGRGVYNFAVSKMTEIIKTLMEKDSLGIEDVDLFVCHQANERIIQAAAKRLGYDMDKFVVTLDEYANTSSSSIPIALADLEEKGKLKKGMRLILAGFGAGLTWGGCVVKW